MDEQQMQLIQALILGVESGDEKAAQALAQLLQQLPLAAQPLAQIAEQMGAKNTALMIAQYAQLMSLYAKMGAKLSYIKRLRGICPEGLEITYYQRGGKTCRKCVEAKSQGSTIQLKTPVKSNAVDEFKMARCGTKMKKKKK